MAASSSRSPSQSSLPQGFSVYQPALGAPLLFFPALGSRQLDGMICAYVPGPAALADKRAAISLDFLEHAQQTGQNFKFYPVCAAAAASVAESPLTASPSLDSANSSSFNPSPVTSSWDWSATASISSRASSQRRRISKAAAAPSPPQASRHRTTDFANLPGMKILTKDGQDVTNSASRGSKTKEQRDHAHLMRIIRACPNCRRKKTRCDPSHRKRGAAQASPQPSGPSRKSKTSPQEQPTPPPPPPQPQPPQQQSPSDSAPPPTTAVDELAAFLTPPFDLDPTLFSLSGPESLDALSAAATLDLWDEFIQFPPMDTIQDHDFFLDPESYSSSHSSAGVSPSSSSPFNAPGPELQRQPGAPPGLDATSLEGLRPRSPQYPFLQQPGSSGDYTDFNLFSPVSSFSEDGLMLSVGSSSSDPLSTRQPLLVNDEYPPAGHDVLGGDGAACEWPVPPARIVPPQLYVAGDNVAGLAQDHDLGHLSSGFSHHAGSSDNGSIHGTEWLHGRGVICWPPGTVLPTAEASAGHVSHNVSTGLSAPGSSALTGVTSSEPPATCVAPSVVASTDDGLARHRSDSPAVGAARGHIPVLAMIESAFARPLASEVNRDNRLRHSSPLSAAAAPMDAAETGGLGILDGARRPEVEPHVSPTNPDAFESRAILGRETQTARPSLTEPPGRPDSAQASPAPLGVLRQQVLQRPLADETVGFVSQVQQQHVDLYASGDRGCDITAASRAISSANRDLVDSSESHVVGSATQCVSGSAAQASWVDCGRQTWRKSAPAWLAVVGAAMAIASALVLSMHGLSVRAPWAYVLGAVLSLASATATATTTTLRCEEQPWAAAEGRPSHIPPQVSSSGLHGRGRGLATVQRRVSRAVTWGLGCDAVPRQPLRG